MGFTDIRVCNVFVMLRIDASVGLSLEVPDVPELQASRCDDDLGQY